MESTTSSSATKKPGLGLFGLLINAMALIAPGAFLWTTYQLQAAPGSAANMWFAVLLAGVVALFTAIAYSMLAKKYPQAGTGSAYYFADMAFLEKEKHEHFKFARVSKFIVGWASHLYYWIYPGVMVAFMGNLIVYIGQIFNPNFASTPFEKMALCVGFAIIVGYIAYRGVNSSTFVNLIINIIQIVSLLSFSALAIIFRFLHPNLHYLHANALSVIRPHDLSGIIFQATIAILLMVGFESATAFSSEARDPKKDIPRAVILSLLIQAGIFYLIEYFAANYFISGTDFTAAFNSIAPIGDMAKVLGDQLLFGGGMIYVVVLASTVVVALIGTALSCTNTGVRITHAMGKDEELPAVFGFIHSKHQSPHIGVIVLTIISAAIGAYGVLNIDNLTQVTLISNIGTFLLYGMTSVICLVAYAAEKREHVMARIVSPAIALLLNSAMLVGVLYFAATSGGTIQQDTIIAAIFSLAWLVIGLAFLWVKSKIQGIPILHPRDHKIKQAIEFGVR